MLELVTISVMNIQRQIGAATVRERTSRSATALVPEGNHA
jgi:hypothetical protein